MISVVIAHKSTPLNDACLELNLRMLKDNTKAEYELVLLDDPEEEVYHKYNRSADVAKYDLLVFTNSDMLMAPEWDVYMAKYVDDNTIVTGYLVECGVIGVSSKNINYDFGRTPGRFDRGSFENFARGYGARVPEVKDESGWYMPITMTKSFFNRMGRYHIEKPFPYHNDILFWDHCREQGAKVKRARSFAYHFQNLSNPDHDHKRA